MSLIKSCAECKTKCCKFGPGPYKLLRPKDFFDVYMTAEGYNIKCNQLKRNGKCSVWGTKDLPEECRSHVCHVKAYNKKELNIINAICEGPCEDCGCGYLIHMENDTYYCEVCGITLTYECKTEVPNWANML